MTRPGHCFRANRAEDPHSGDNLKYRVPLAPSCIFVGACHRRSLAEVPGRLVAVGVPRIWTPYEGEGYSHQQFHVMGIAQQPVVEVSVHEVGVNLKADATYPWPVPQEQRPA